MAVVDKLLVVEDSVPILKLIKHIGKRAGYQIDTAQSLAETQTLLDNNDDYTIASIDYNLPDAAHGEAIDLVLSHKIPSIVLTGFMNDDIREAILSRPVVDYIPKETTQALYYLEKLLNRLRVNKTTKVLVVDDSRSQRSYIKSLLNRHNFQILEAENGEEGLKQVKAHTDIKLIITDHEMPVMGGIRFVAEVRRIFDKDEMAIIGLSGADTNSLSARFIKSGANDFLKKPFCHEEFYCRIVQNIEHLEYVEQINKAANTDYLTGLYNRRYFFDKAPNKMQQTELTCIAMLDIDFFKRINDNYGHDAGDAIILDIAEKLQSHFSDCIISRFGGEEFCLLMSDYGLQHAVSELDNFRRLIADNCIVYNEDEIEYTLSIGVTAEIAHIEKMIAKSDTWLYQAKEKGRNQIVSDLDAHS